MQKHVNNAQIPRNLGIISATAIVVANMIGTGILTTSGIMAENLPNAIWVIGCWFLGGMIALSGALCYSECEKYMNLGDMMCCFFMRDCNRTRITRMTLISADLFIFLESLNIFLLICSKFLGETKHTQALLHSPGGINLSKKNNIKNFNS